MHLHPRLVERYATDGAVYAAAYSRDGDWLAYGGGNFYGGGFICSAVRGASDTWSDRTQWQKRAVSGLAFDDSDSYLAVSTWGQRHSPAPALLYEVVDGKLAHEQVYSWLPEGRGSHGMATGVLLHEGWLIVRCTAPFHKSTFKAFRAPSGVRAGNMGQHLRSARLVGLPGSVVTGFLPSGLRNHDGMQVDFGTFDDMDGRQPNRIGNAGAVLVAAVGESGLGLPKALANPHALDGATAKRVHQALPLNDFNESQFLTLGVREPPCGSVSAIAINSTASEIVTCGSDGSIAHSSCPEVRREWVRPGHVFPITAACFVEPTGLLVTGDRSGLVRIWDGVNPAAEWTVADSSIRSLAAHPTLPKIAVGCKSLWDGRGGSMAVFDLGG